MAPTVAGVPRQRSRIGPQRLTPRVKTPTSDVIPSGTDSSAVRVVALARVAALLAVAGVGSFTASAHGRVAALMLIIGLAGVPWATVVFFGADRPDNRLAVYGGPLGDLLVLFAVQALLPGSAEAVLPGYLVLVAFTVYTAGQSFAGVIVAGGVTLTLIAHAISPTESTLRTAVTVPFAIGVIALLVLVERTTLLQVRATTTSDRLRGRADTVLAHVADAVLVTDGNGRLLLSNPAADRLLSQPAGQKSGSPCHLVLGLHDGERPLECSNGCALVRADAPPGGREVWRYDASGRRQPLLADAAQVTAADGAIEVIHTVRDITRLKQAEEAKTLFLATASHELKTPLTVIAGFASTLIRYPDLDAEMRASALDAIHTRAGELTRIVERLLLSSRIEAGQVDLELEPTAIPDLLRDRVAACAAGMARTVTFSAADDVPPALASTQALITVVDHLLDNAIKYSPNGEPIDVIVTTQPETVRIDIADHGIGMDDDQAEHCFDRFWQAESTDVRRFGGTGIGLYIVRSLVETMRGSIRVESVPGAGTTFVLALPRADVVPTQREDPSVGEPTSIREFMRQIGVPERARP